MSQRTDRLDSQIRAELAELLHREMKDPRVGFATITRVETARDLGTAKVWVSIMGTETEREQTMKALTDATPWLRRQPSIRSSTTPHRQPRQKETTRPRSLRGRTQFRTGRR